MLARPEPAELDGGPRSARPALARHCALTREVKPVGDMIRFVVGPHDAVVADLKRRLPGRGLWITATRGAIADAVKRGVFARGFKRQVVIPEGFLETLDALLMQSALDALAIAGKAGEVVCGFTKVEDALRTGKAIAVIHAAEAALDGKRKLDGIPGGLGAAKGPKAPPVGVFSSDQLDLALGRSNVIHAALLAGPASETFLERTQRLSVFRGPDRQDDNAQS